MPLRELVAVLRSPRGVAPAIAATLVASLVGCGGGGGAGSGVATSGLEASGSKSTTSTLNDPGCHYQYEAGAAPVPGSGADPRLAQQWHLSNVGQGGGTAGVDLDVFAAWTRTKGSGVSVAVVDDAVEVVHEDLVPNVEPGSSFNYRGAGYGNAYPLPCAEGETHGTAVAGVLSARDDNGVGIAGVAPRARIAAFNALSTNLDADIADALTRDLQVHAVYHNSWGSPDNGSLHPVDASFDVAIANGRDHGRGGKGAVYVFPAGNGGYLDDNSNYDGYVNKRGVIAACAVDDDGRKPWYGEPGANILVCGYSSNLSSAITTTAVGNGYRENFTGTSASAPMVSGVAALMLATNPQLSWRDVMLILAGTARRTDPSHPQWSLAGARAFNPYYGFGAVDAKAAVDAAAGWVSVGGSAEQLACESTPRAPALPIADAGATAPGPWAEDSVTISGCPITRVEFVEVRFSAAHSYAGDLAIELDSPSSTTSVLASERLCLDDPSQSSPSIVDCGSYADWRFGSVRHLDEPAAGVWRLRVRDAQSQDTGTFTGWQLRIWGR